MSSCNYGCATLPDHQQVDCGEFSNGGISGLAIIECDHTITDFSSAILWNQNIASGKVKIIKSVKAEVPDSAPASVDNPIGCGAQQIMIGQDTTINWTDANVAAANDDFYAKLNFRRSYIALFSCENGEVLVSSDPATFTARGRMIPNDNRQLSMYNATATLFSKKGEIPLAAYTAPAGIFE